MKSAEIRDAFLKFFESKGHQIVVVIDRGQQEDIGKAVKIGHLPFCETLLEMLRHKMGDSVQVQFVAQVQKFLKVALVCRVVRSQGACNN